MILSNKAFLFDLNGTMIDDMEFHADAWYYMATKLGSPWTRDRVQKELYGKNEEVLSRIFTARHFSDAEMQQISIEKETIYQSAFRPFLKLLPGLDDFLEKAYQEQIGMAVCSAAIPFNIDFVLDNLNIRKYFPVTVSADDVTHSKPDPETFTKAAVQLGADPSECIVFEDNPKGVEAAVRGGMRSVVVTTMHTPEEFEGLPGILLFVEDFTDPRLDELFRKQDADIL